MVTRRDIVDLANVRINHILDVAEASLPPCNFEAFKRIVLKQFGDRCFVADLDRLLSGSAAGLEWNGKGRNDTGRKGGAR